jgi:oxygen-dependent protoporphyrinogen oxidase
MKPKFHIIGGGINGIISALYIKKENNDFEVYLHESLSELGGKLLGFDYKDDELYYDKGTHIFQESGNVFLDELILEAIQKQDLTFYPKGKGDIVGSIQNNILQTESHFINLLNNPGAAKMVKKHIASLEKSLKSIDVFTSASDELEKRFGVNFRDNYEKIFSSLFKHSPNELSAICLTFIGSTRIILDDFPKWVKNSQSTIYRSVVGVPNQLKLPKKYSHNRKSFYPKEKGTKSLILGLIRLLDKYDIKIIKNSKVQTIRTKGKKITSLVNNQLISFDYDKVLIASGVISATKILDPSTSIKLSPPMKTTFFNVELEHKTLKDIFYFYNFDSDENFFRVTNYRAFSNKTLDKRITIECFKLEDNTDKQLKNILEYLKSLGFIKNASFKNVKIENDPYGFPVLSVSNLKKIKDLEINLKSKISHDLEVSGIGTGEFNFFQTEIILDSLHKIDKLVKKLISVKS